MKQKITGFWIFMALLWIPLYAHAYDFAVDGFEYEVIDAVAGTVKIVGGGSLDQHELHLPNTVSYKGKNLIVRTLAAAIGINVETLYIPSNINLVEGSGAGIPGGGCLKDKNVSQLIIEDSEDTLVLRDAYYSSGNSESQVGAFYNTPLKNVYLGRTVEGTNRSYTSNSSPFRSQKFLEKVEIGPLCKRISKYLFSGIKTLGEIVFQNNSNLKIIEENAFSNDCIEFYNFPTEVEVIEKEAFYYCTGGTNKIIIPPSILSIGEKAFCGSSVLNSEIRIASGCIVGDAAFAEVTGVEKINLPNTWENIPPSCFRNISTLKEINTPSNLKSIGEYAFSGCTSLTHFNNPIDQYEVGEWAFKNSGIRSLEFEHQIIQPTLINHCQDLDSLKFTSREGITIKPYFFDPTETGFDYSCNELNSQMFDIRGWCMASLDNLEYLEFSSNVNYSGYIKSAFAPSSGRLHSWSFKSPFKKHIRGTVKYTGEMTDVSDDFPFGNQTILGRKITKLGNDIFSTQYGSNWSVICYSPFPPKCSSTTFSEACYMEYKLFVPHGCLEEYQNDQIWGKFWEMEELPEIKPKTILLDYDTLSLEIDQTVQVESTVIPEDASYDALYWTSSDDSIATVSDSGLVTAVSSGSCFISCTCQNLSASCLVNVNSTHGIDLIEQVSENITYVYSIDGRLMKRINEDTNLPNLPNGIYIVKINDKAYKIKI